MPVNRHLDMINLPRGLTYNTGERKNAGHIQCNTPEILLQRLISVFSMHNNMIIKYWFTSDCHYKISINQSSLSYKSRTKKPLKNTMTEREFWEPHDSYLQQGLPTIWRRFTFSLTVYDFIYGCMPCQVLKCKSKSANTYLHSTTISTDWQRLRRTSIATSQACSSMVKSFSTENTSNGLGIHRKLSSW